MTELVPVSLDEARRFVAQLHRHNKPPRTWKFGVGLEHEGALVGVAMAGRIVSRELQTRQPRAIEITRVCTDETRNANSRLYGALCRAAKALGYQRAYTYTLEEESGASLRAAGFVVDGTVAARDHHGGRARYQENLLGEAVRPEGAKLRWRRDL